MKVLWITWKDHVHPAAGGAEVVARELTLRLAKEGHSVTILTAKYPGAHAEVAADGITFIRLGGNRYILPIILLWYYLRHLRNKYDVLIEEVQGAAPYFAVAFERRAKKYFFYHQLGRINWLYEVPKPFSYAGYWLFAPIATRLASLTRAPVITVSQSTRNVLAGYGFKPERTHIIAEGLHFKPLADVKQAAKYRQPTVLSFGAMRAMKRTLDQVKAFEIARESMPNLCMKLAGDASGAYGQTVLNYIAQSPFRNNIEYLGRVDTAGKAELMQRSHAILVTSVEEGWGLVVSEANVQGTPAVVYDVSGLRDSTQDGETGIVTAENPTALAGGIVTLLSDPKTYSRLQENAWQWSKTLTFEQSYKDFCKTTGVNA